MNQEIIIPDICILGTGECSMKIRKMTIDNVCGIKYLDINFNEGLNLICGENGMGKTTIIKAIEYKLKCCTNINFIKSLGKGKIDIQFTKDGKDVNNNNNNNNIKKWLITDYAFSKVENELNEFEKSRPELSKRILNMLDENLNIESFEILSDGYKSCAYILLGILKEIMYRFPNMCEAEFSGIIMIDEIDLHLHPNIQSKFIKVLKQSFPKAQIIATTYSPSILQTAGSNEIIPLYKDQSGDVKIKNLFLSEYGLQGWTLEEIMEDVMGMTTTNSELYTKTMQEFCKAMYEDNAKMAKEKYNTLCKMLHPRNELRQLLLIQMAGMGDE